MFLRPPVGVLQWFLKDHVTLRTLNSNVHFLSSATKTDGLELLESVRTVWPWAEWRERVKDDRRVRFRDSITSQRDASFRNETPGRHVLRTNQTDLTRSPTGQRAPLSSHRTTQVHCTVLGNTDAPAAMFLVESSIWFIDLPILIWQHTQKYTFIMKKILIADLNLAFSWFFLFPKSYICYEICY